ncbi:MAG: hypothetical protein WB760_11050 [Xanthobacteraceae bacterium]
MSDIPLPTPLPPLPTWMERRAREERRPPRRRWINAVWHGFLRSWGDLRFKLFECSWLDLRWWLLDQIWLSIVGLLGMLFLGLITPLYLLASNKEEIHWYETLNLAVWVLVMLPAAFCFIGKRVEAVEDLGPGWCFRLLCGTTAVLSALAFGERKLFDAWASASPASLGAPVAPVAQPVAPIARAVNETARRVIATGGGARENRCDVPGSVNGRALVFEIDTGDPTMADFPASYIDKLHVDRATLEWFELDPGTRYGRVAWAIVREIRIGDVVWENPRVRFYENWRFSFGSEENPLFGLPALKAEGVNVEWTGDTCRLTVAVGSPRAGLGER